VSHAPSVALICLHTTVGRVGLAFKSAGQGHTGSVHITNQRGFQSSFSRHAMPMVD
jgi:hypothetical protein